MVALRALPGVGPMWDLTLDSVHTFAVGQLQAVVHNNCGDSAKVNFDDHQVMRKFKHAPDFGVTGNNNGTNRQVFVTAMKAHLENPDTFERPGTLFGQPEVSTLQPERGLKRLR